MSRMKHSGGMKLIVDANCVTLYMVGEKIPVLIQRPSTVSVSEWEDFWGGEIAPNHRVPGSLVGTANDPYKKPML